MTRSKAPQAAGGLGLQRERPGQKVSGHPLTAIERERLRQLPKAELHLHLEGSLSPETLLALSRRQNAPFGLRDLESCRRLYQFQDFAGFIQAIKTASQHLVTPADYAAAVRGLARELQRQGVVYAEVFVSIGILLWRRVPVEPYWEAMEAARVEAEAQAGVRLRWLFDAVRQFGPEPLDQVCDWAIKLQTSGSVLGIGVGGDENQVATAALAPAYARVRAAGLKTTVHAGETRGPDAVWEAIEQLQPDRIGHGLHAVKDERLLDELARRRIILDVCPTSNFKTGAWPATKPHPCRQFYDCRVVFSISTDDPGIFACTLLDEYAFLAEACGFSFDELLRLSSFAWDCSFLPEAERRLMRALPGLPPADAVGDRRV